MRAFFSARWRAIGLFGTRDYVVRLLFSLVSALTLMSLASPVPFYEPSYMSDGRLFLTLLFTLVFFALTLLLPRDRAVTLLLLGVFTLLAVHAAILVHEWYFGIALALLAGTLVFFLRPVLPGLFPGRRFLIGYVALLFAAMALFIGILTALPYLNHWAPTYDFGIFTQMFHYMKETGAALTTCERDGLLSHFAVHASPIYYLLLPVYLVFPSGVTLLVMQGIIVASGILPLVLIARGHGLSYRATAVFATLYALYPALLEGNFFYLHENCFLPPLLLWLFYAWEKKSSPWVFLAALLVLGVKEDAAVYVAVFALYGLLSGKRRRTSLGVLLLSVLYFLLVTSLMKRFGEGIMSDSRYGEYIYGEGGLFSVIKTVIQNPLYAVKRIFTGEKLLFLLQMLLPLGFLPLAIRRPARLVLLIPLVLVNLMTSYVYQYDITFQYVYGTSVFLFYLAVTQYAELREGRQGFLLATVLAATILFASVPAGRLSAIENYRASESVRSEMNAALSTLPDEASVAATTFLLTSLAEREEIYELETTVHFNEVEYIVIDRRYDTDALFLRFSESGAHALVLHKEGVVAIFQRVGILP